MAIAVSQATSAGAGSSSATSRAATFTSSVTVGHSVVVTVNSRYPITTVTDNKSNTYVKVAEKAFSGSCVSIWLSAAVATGGSSFTVTATAGSLAGPIMLAAVEVDKNLKSLLSVVGGTGPSNTPGLAFPVTPAEAYVAIAFDAGPSSGTINGSPSGWTSRAKDTLVQLAEAMDRVFSSAAVSASYTWTIGVARSWVACGAVFGVALQADFTGTPLSGLAPVTVAFTDASTGSPSTWNWDFGDGSTSTSQNPSHDYTVAGTYNVTLTVTNAGGISTFTRTGYVVISGAGSGGGTTPTPPGIPTAEIVTFGPPIPGAPWNVYRPYVPSYDLPPAPAQTTHASSPLLVPTVTDTDRLQREARLVSLFLNALSRLQQLFRLGENSFGIRTAGIPSTRAPTVTDDETTGARVGVIWCDQTAGRAYYCSDQTQGAAVWREISLIPLTGQGVSGGISGTFPG